MNILLLHYNNYFNRRIKKLDTITEYTAADAYCYECDNINFNPNDDINASVTLGFGTNPVNVFANGCDYDYAVVFKEDATTPGTYIIKSR